MISIFQTLFEYARATRAELLMQSGWVAAAYVAVVMGGASIALAPLNSDTFNHKYQRTKKKSKVLVSISRVLIVAGVSLLSNLYLDGVPSKRIISETSDMVTNIRSDIEKIMNYAQQEGLLSYISNSGASLLDRLDAEADNYIDSWVSKPCHPPVNFTNKSYPRPSTPGAPVSVANSTTATSAEAPTEPQGPDTDEASVVNASVPLSSAAPVDDSRGSESTGSLSDPPVTKPPSESDEVNASAAATPETPSESPLHASSSSGVDISSPPQSATSLLSDDMVQIMLPVNGKSYKLSFKNSVKALEVAINFCDSIAPSLNLKGAEYHTKCLGPVESYVAKEIRAYFKSKLEAKRALETPAEPTAHEEATSAQSGISSATPDAPSVSTPQSPQLDEPASRSLSRSEQMVMELNRRRAAEVAAKLENQASQGVHGPLVVPNHETSAEDVEAQRASLRDAMAKNQAIRLIRNKVVNGDGSISNPTTTVSTGDATTATGSEVGVAEGASIEAQIEAMRRNKAELEERASRQIEAEKELREKEREDRVRFLDKRSRARLEALRAKAAEEEAKANKVASSAEDVAANA